MTKLWEQNPDTYRGWWAAAGRNRDWKFEPPIWLSLKDKNFVLGIVVAGLMVDWNCRGVYVSIGATKIGFAGIGWCRGYGA